MLAVSPLLVLCSIFAFYYIHDLTAVLVSRTGSINMSFGFGVGDFLAVIELANKVRQKWKDAPEEYDTMKDE